MNDIYGQNVNPYNYVQTDPFPNSNINWVQGEAAAKVRSVNRGGSGVFFDSEKNMFYVKTVDYAGMPQPLRYFEYTEVYPNAQPQAVSMVSVDDFAKKQDLDSLRDKVDELKKLIDDLTK